MPHGAKEIDYRTVILAAEGKVRGSRARRLGEELEAIFNDGYDQVVLDLRSCVSIDSVGALSIVAALERGQRLFVVRAPGAASADLFPPEVAADERLPRFSDPGEAIRCARAQEESGILAI